ncbi:MAG: hypothetical protein ABIS67_10320, partial [Candidatus Eisenbacteria bacterium]
EGLMRRGALNASQIGRLMMRRVSPVSVAVLAVASLLTLAGPGGALSPVRGGSAPDMPKPRGLPSPAGRGAAESRLVTTPDGAVLMSWLEPRLAVARSAPAAGTGKSGHAAGAGHALRLASLRAARWSPVLTVAEGDSFFVNWADFPAVCAFGEHGLAVAWLWKSGAETYDYQTRVAISADGGGVWTEPIIIHDDRDGTEHGFVSLLPQGVGVRAVWLDGHNFTAKIEEGMADMTVHSRFISPTGTLGREQELDDRACDCCQTAAVAVGADILVAYRDRNSEEIRDISLVRLDGGKWSKPAPLHQDGWHIPGCPVNGPALAAVGERVAIAWYTAAADSPRVYAAFSENGGRKFGNPIRVDEGKPLGRVGVAVLADGSAAVSWMEEDGKQARVRARFVREGARPGAAATVARIPGARASGVPQMVRDGERLVFSWTEPGKPGRLKLAAVKLPRN